MKITQIEGFKALCKGLRVLYLVSCSQVRLLQICKNKKCIGFFWNNKANFDLLIKRSPFVVPTKVFA